MVSTLTILLASLLSLFLVWKALHPGFSQIRSLEDWEEKKHEVDPEVFRSLLNPDEERYLRRSLLPREFRHFQRRRVGLALRVLDLVQENASMLMRLGQLAKADGRPELAKEAADLIYGALWLRVNLARVQPCLFLMWLAPGWTFSLPTVETGYQELLEHLGRMRQQRLWELQPGLLAK